MGVYRGRDDHRLLMERDGGGGAEGEKEGVWGEGGRGN